MSGHKLEAVRLACGGRTGGEEEWHTCNCSDLQFGLDARDWKIFDPENILQLVDGE